MDSLIQNIKVVADKPLTYNQDINHHIISCRGALQIIEVKDKQLLIKQGELDAMLIEKLKLQRKIYENEQLINHLQEKLKIQREIINENYKIINELK